MIFLILRSCVESLPSNYRDPAAAFAEDMWADQFKSFGNRILRRRSVNQEKRDISLSYAATNINSKEGTQVKTITVLKNLSDNDKQQQQKLKINPELHKNENWAEAFRDNFDSYGLIPDVPDVDDLFEYVNKKHASNSAATQSKTENMTKEATKTTVKPKPMSKPKEESVKPVKETSSESIETDDIDEIKPVEKIKGDAELLPNLNSSRLLTKESLINFNYSTPNHSVHQYFENYIQLSPASTNGYNYPKPCVHPQPISSVTVATTSGRTYNIPANNNSITNPYLAPSITRRPQVQQTTTPSAPANAPVFPINSLLPPLEQQSSSLQPQQNNFLSQNQGNLVQSATLPNPVQANFPVNLPATQQTQVQLQPQNTQQTFPSTTQRPYVAPNLRSGLSGVNRGAGSVPLNNVGFRYVQPAYRINNVNTGFRSLNIGRSRGIKY